MKKILSIFSALFLMVSTTLSVVACAPKPENDVLFLLPGDAVKSDLVKAAQAYKIVADEFNHSDEMKTEKVKVKVKWEDKGSVRRRIRGKEPLPDLYLSYADDVSDFVLGVNTKDKVRDMEQTVIQDSNINHEEFKNLFWTESLYNEGVINDKLFVLPMNKSYDISIINLKVFLELVSFVNSTWARQIATALSQEPRAFNTESSKLFLPLKSDQTLEVSPNLNQALEKIANAPVKSMAIRLFFQKNQNVLDLASIYHQLYRSNLDLNSLKENYLGKNGDPKLMYALGLETPANRIYMEYADAMNQANINPMDLSGADFFYNIKNLNSIKEKAEIILDQPTSPIFSKIADFFEQFRQWAPKTGENSAYRWSGSMVSGKNVDLPKIVAGHYFVQGTMLLTSGTSAGSYDYNPDYNNKDVNLAQPQFDRDQDLMVVSTSTAMGNYANFLQQGAGIAGFKSTGKTAEEKEIVVNKFLNYLLDPIVQNRLAIMSGYLPSTSKALEMYRYYKSDLYNNATGKWASEDIKPDNWADFEQVPNLDALSPKQEPISERDFIMTDFLDNFALPSKTINLPYQVNMVTTTANPFGSVIRNAVSNALKSQIFIDPEHRKFTDLLKDDNELWNIKRVIKTNLPEGYLNAIIKFRENKIKN